MHTNNPQIKNLIREKQGEFLELVREISENAIFKGEDQHITPGLQDHIKDVQGIAAKKLAKKYGYDIDDDQEDEEDF